MRIIRTLERPRLKIIRNTPRYWSVHTHSKFSANDALAEVDAIVARAAQMGQQAIGLTDHGNMAGSVQLYRAAKSHGLAPFPGTELYFVDSIAQHKYDYAARDRKASRTHLCVLANNRVGYGNLVRLNTLTHHQHFHKPLLDMASLADFAQQGYTEGLVVTTGCYFGKAVQGLVNQGPMATAQWLRTLDTWFPGATYVELQNHNIDHGNGWTDDLVADALDDIARELGLPVILTQDSHYVEAVEKEDHDALKRLVSFGPDLDDAVFPGDGFHLVDDAWMRRHHSASRRERGYEGLGDLLARADLAIGPLDSYSYAVPLPVPDPDRLLKRRCIQALDGLLHTTPSVMPRKSSPYWFRLDEELDVITSAGFAGYLLLAADVTDHCHSQGIIFQTRGSAGGSLVCYLLGITSADPIKWNLRFERFLSKDRTKPPDIDLDIEHERRDELISWLSSKYAVHQIGTWAEMSMSGDEETSKGSLLIKYYSAARKVDGATSWNDVPVEHREQLRRLDGYRPFSGPGTNAAGLTVTSTKAEFDALVPQMYMAERKGYLSQYDKDDIERLGLVKLDVMGLKTLSVISRTLDLVGKQGLDWIPLTDRETYSFIRTGNTDGIFQLSGKTTSRGLRELKPTKIADVIAAMALFRPATMKSGATDAFIRRKHGLETVPKRHELIQNACKETFGILLYQEQVIQVLRELGMDKEDLTKFLKAVKASNKDIGGAGQVIAGYRSHIHTLCEKVGMSDADTRWLEEALEAYSGYGFNSAHATIYGITAYRAAYLCVHYPVEFHTALLGVYAGDKDKEPIYLRATRNRQVPVYRPDINVSGYTYTMDKRRHAVRKGLLAIKGVGKVVAAELVKHQPYTDLEDLATRVDHRKVTGVKDYRLSGDDKNLTGVLATLVESGVVDNLL